MLASTDYETEKRSETCWKPPDCDYFGGDDDADVTALASGESFRHEYDLWTRSDAEGCLPSGTYHFGYFREENSPSWRVTLDVKKPTD